MDYQEAIEYMRKESHNQRVNSEGQDAYIIAISAMQELQEYKQLGTLEKVSDAVEKQKKERPQKVLGIFGGEEYECRECGNTVEYMDEYCKWCGQKLNWSEVEE